MPSLPPQEGVMASPPRGLTWDAKHNWLRLDRSMSFAFFPPLRGYALNLRPATTH
ncbi:MAG: hypothetical protein J6X49_14535 [Victivallales bacterium]|nr:hypothetical protein [Victivallales bacterium]